jgi:hypothetical protein
MAKTRSPNYPGVSLPEAVELVTKLYQAEKRAPVDAERGALALGYRSLSGAARTKLSALRKFDLVEETGSGIRVSDLAMAILHPTNPHERQEALREAATTPALFRDLSEFPGASDENLISRLVRLGFTEAGARLAVASYRKTMSLVPGEASEYDAEHDEFNEVLGAPELPRATQPRSAAPRSNQGSVLTIALPGGADAELRLPDRLTPDALKAVVDWLGTAPRVPEASEPTVASPSPDPDASAPLLLSGQSPDDAQESAS